MTAEAVENQPRREVAPEATRATVMEFFDGVDLTASGSHKNGLIDISVNEQGLAVAKVNNARVAAKNGDHIYLLFGSEDSGTGVRGLSAEA